MANGDAKLKDLSGKAKAGAATGLLALIGSVGGLGMEIMTNQSLLEQMEKMTEQQNHTQQQIQDFVITCNEQTFSCYQARVVCDE